MTLLKAAEFNQATPGNQVFNLNDIADEARDILDNARRESESLLRQARQDIARDRQRGQEHGHSTGLEQGLKEGQKQGQEQALEQGRKEYAEKNTSISQSLKAICTDFDSNKNELLWQAEQNVVALVIAMTRKVVKKIGLINRDVAVGNIKSALELLSKTTNVIVKVNPLDAEHLDKMLQGSSSPFDGYSSITFEKTETIEAGGCLLITEQGQIDGQLDTQIDRIADELLTTSEKDENNVIVQEIINKPPPPDGEQIRNMGTV